MSRAKRQSSFYFDVDAWEKERAAEQAAKLSNADGEPAKKKKPTKKELVRFWLMKNQ